MTVYSFLYHRKLQEIAFCPLTNSKIMHRGIGEHRRVWTQTPRHKHKTPGSAVEYVVDLWSKHWTFRTFLGGLQSPYICITSTSPRKTKDFYYYLKSVILSVLIEPWSCFLKSVAPHIFFFFRLKRVRLCFPLLWFLSGIDLFTAAIFALNCRVITGFP